MASEAPHKTPKGNDLKQKHLEKRGGAMRTGIEKFESLNPPTHTKEDYAQAAARLMGDMKDVTQDELMVEFTEIIHELRQVSKIALETLETEESLKQFLGLTLRVLKQVTADLKFVGLKEEEKQ